MSDAKFASLLAFMESRMSMESDDCGRNGGQFAPGNHCQAGAGTGEKQPSQTGLLMRNGIAGDRSLLTFTHDHLERDKPFPGADKLKQITVRKPKEVAEKMRDGFGLNDMETALRIGAAVQKGAHVSVHPKIGYAVGVDSMQPLDPSRPELGECSVQVTLRKEGSEKTVHYDYLGVNERARSAIDSKQFSERRIATEMMARMLDSMAASERIGVSKASMLSAGQGTGSGDIDHATGELRGYKLWPTFGFDGDVPSRLMPTVPRDILAPEAAEALSKTGKLTVQQLWLTRKGEEWWKQNGSSTQMTFDYKDKSSLGYKRYERLRKMQDSRKSRREKRDIVEYAIYGGIERRDTQLTLGLSGDNGDDCGRNGGRFAPGNHCQAGGLAPPDKAVSPVLDAIKKSVKKGADSITLTREQITSGKPFTTNNNIERLEIEAPKAVNEIAKKFGAKSLENVLRIGAALNDGASVHVAAYTSSYAQDEIKVSSQQPVDQARPELGEVTVSVKLKAPKGESPAQVYYGLMSLDRDAKSAIAQEKITQHGMGVAVMDRMTDSLVQTERLGIEYAKTSAARGADGPGEMVGYKLWPSFGFDGPLSPHRPPPPRDVLNDAAKAILDAGGTLTVQHVIASREGEEWWEKNGYTIDLKLDFKDKQSLGYKRYSRLVGLAARRKSRHSRRAFLEWAIFESRGRDLLEWPGFAVETRYASLLAFAESRDCGRIAGKFGPGNHCQEGADDPESAATADIVGDAIDNNDDLYLAGPALQNHKLFSNASQLEELTVQRLDDTMKLARTMGIKDGDQLLDIGACAKPGANVEVTMDGREVRGEMRGMISVESTIPVDDDKPENGTCSVSVQLFATDPGEPLSVHYDFFKPSGMAFQAIEAGRLSKTRVSNAVFDLMTKSLEAAEQAGATHADTLGVGDGRDQRLGSFAGYRLWPKFGFDAELHRYHIDSIPDSILTDEQIQKKADHSLTLQGLVSTREGMKWWDKHGSPIHMTLDFKDKNSIGYKRYRDAADTAARARQRKSSRAMDYASWVMLLDENPIEFRDYAGDLEGIVERRSDDCGRDGGKFAKGNHCQAEGDAGQPQAEPETGSRREGLKKDDDGPFSVTRQHTKVRLTDAKDTKEAMAGFGFKNLDDVLTLGAATADGREAVVAGKQYPSAYDGTTVQKMNIRSKIPLDPDDHNVGNVDVEVSALRTERGSEVHYDWLGLSDDAVDSVKSEDYPLHRITSKVIDLMTASIDKAEELGVDYLYTVGGRDDFGESVTPQPGDLAGYRLWPKFGFDATLDEDFTRSIPVDVLSPQADEKRDVDGTLTVQDVIESPKGRRWWNENGEQMEFSFNLRDKSSKGYQRLQKMRSMAERVRREGRSFDFMAWAIFSMQPGQTFADFPGSLDAESRSLYSESLLSGLADLLGTPRANNRSLALDCRVASLLAFAEARNCGTGPGGFQKGNTCAAGAAVDAAKGAAKGAVEGALFTSGFSWLPQHLAAGAAVGAGVGAVKGLYDNQMHPTRVMKRIKDIGSSEERISEMVKKLGGSPKSSAHLGKHGSVSLHIKDKDGNHVFTVEVEKSHATVYPRRPNGELTTQEIDKVKEIAQKGLPAHVDIVVKSRSWHYTAKLARKGFVLTAKAAGSVVASYVGPTVVDTLVGDAAYALAKRIPRKV